MQVMQVMHQIQSLGLLMLNIFIFQVWYHKCSNRGKGCSNTNLLETGGCSIWYNELQVTSSSSARKEIWKFSQCNCIFCSAFQYLADVEDHLDISIPECGSDLNVPVNEFDGKVTYGAKRGKPGTVTLD